MEGLLQEGSAESRRLARNVFQGVRLAGFRAEDRVSVIKSMIARGIPDGYRYYLPLLDVTGNQYGSSGYGQPVRKVFADEIMRQLAPNDPEIKRITKSGKPIGQQIGELKKWLKKKVGEMENKK